MCADDKFFGNRKDDVGNSGYVWNGTVEGDDFFLREAGFLGPDTCFLIGLICSFFNIKCQDRAPCVTVWWGTAHTGRAEWEGN